MNCPLCNKKLILKREEAYKQFYICSTKNCYIVSVIITTTLKDLSEDEK